MSKLEQILHDRALLLAQKKEEKGVCESDCTTMLQVGLSDRKYCIEASFVKEILTTNSIIPVPGVGNVVHGIINVRGKIVAIINLSILFGIQDKTNDQNRVVVLKDEMTGMEFGILVNEISQTISVKNEEIKELPLNIRGISKKNLSGITRDGLIIINTKNLINDTSLKVSKKNSEDKS